MKPVFSKNQRSKFVTIKAVRRAIRERHHRLSQIELAFPGLVTRLNGEEFRTLMGEMMEIPSADFPGDRVGVRQLIETKVAGYRAA